MGNVKDRIDVGAVTASSAREPSMRQPVLGSRAARGNATQDILLWTSIQVL